MIKISFDDLKGKVCVITGGAGVIGDFTCESTCFSRNVKIAIVDINKELAQKVAS